MNEGVYRASIGYAWNVIEVQAAEDSGGEPTESMERQPVAGILAWIDNDILFN